MGWSLSSVSFRMSGSGSWENLLPDQASRQLYAEIYPMGIPLPTLPGHLRKFLPDWEQAGIVQLENQKIIPLGPIMTDDDLKVFNPWFQDISDFMCQAVLERMDDYRALASNLGGNRALQKREIDNLLTILICALTLDSRVFSGLREEVIGTYPSRGVAGNFFFWGYAFATGPQRIFGFTTYYRLDRKQLHMIRSHGLDRRGIKASFNQRATWTCLDFYISRSRERWRAFPFVKEQGGSLNKVEQSLQSVGLLTRDNPPHLAIPIFTANDQEAVSNLCRKISKKIISHFMAGMDQIKYLADQCSFAKCSWPDVHCMLFHLAYSYAADRLVDQGIISDFPQKADGEWGVWIHKIYFVEGKSK